MTVKEKTAIRNYCLWLYDKISGILLVKRDCETYLLVGETEDGIYVKKLISLSYNQDDTFDFKFGEKEFVPFDKVSSYKFLSTRYDLLKLFDKEGVEVTDVEELRNRLFVPYEIGEVIAFDENKYLIIGVQGNNVELLNITGLKRVTLKGIKEKCAQARPKGMIISMAFLRNLYVKVEKQFKEESIKDLSVKVKMTWEV